MNLEELLQEYETDSKIDEKKLDISSLNTIQMHVKYLRFLMEYKAKRIKIESEFEEMRSLRLRYYRGELSQDVLVAQGWAQYQGNKVLKSEVDEFLRTDPILIKLKVRVDYINEFVFCLESILKAIAARDWSIKKAIAFKQWQSGS